MPIRGGIATKRWGAQQTIYGYEGWQDRPCGCPGLQPSIHTRKLVEQKVGHFLATKVAPKALVLILRLRRCGDEIQVTNSATLAGGRQDAWKLKADAMGRQTLERSDQASSDIRGLESTTI